jgi:hypothetical protein
VTATAAASQQSQEESAPPARWLWGAGYFATAVLLFLCYLRVSTRPQQPAAHQALADWLAVHHLTTGLGSYAEGNSVTLDSHGAILLAAPAWFPYGVFPGDHEAKAADFDPRLHDATFFVTTAQDGPAFTIPAARIIGAFGEPAHTYHYRGWTIMTWPENLLTDIRRS